MQAAGRGRAQKNARADKAPRAALTMPERRIYVVRHAIAEDRSASGRDADRALTREGRKKMRRAAHGLACLGVEVPLLLTSPLVRARETADVVAEVLGKATIEVTEALAPGFDPAHLAAVVEQRSPKDSVMLVGHEPDMGALLAAWLTGSSRGFATHFRKGAVACLGAGMLPPQGRATLEWFATCDQLGMIAPG
jgi:phosphohistidine phosphatase